MTLPWEKTPLQETVEALQRDFAFAVNFTAVYVHSNNLAFAMLVNTARGQLVPSGVLKYADGTTVELQDIGMCQPNVQQMTVQEIVTKIQDIAAGLGLELA